MSSDDILGDNPLQRSPRDSIWNLPPDEPESDKEQLQEDEPLNFANPLDEKDIDETVFSENAEKESEEQAEAESDASPEDIHEEEQDFFDIPDFPDSPLDEQEQEQLSQTDVSNLSDSDLAEAVGENSAEEVVLNEAGETDKTNDEGGANSEVDEGEPVVASLPKGGDKSGYEKLTIASGRVEITELTPLVSASGSYQKLNNEPAFAQNLANEVAIASAATSTPQPEADVVTEKTAPAPASSSSTDSDIPLADASGLITVDDLGFLPGNSSPSQSGGASPVALGELSGCVLTPFDSAPLPVATDRGESMHANNVPTSGSSSLPTEMITEKVEEEDPRLKNIDSYDDILQLVGFKLENEMYGVDIMLVQEIIRPQMVTPVPRVAHYVIGVLNLRGKVMPIVDLRRRFSLPSIPMTTETRIIIAQLDVGVMGFVVDAVTEVIRLKKNAIEAGTATTTNINSEYIKGIGHLGEDGSELLILVDINKVVSKKEQEIAELLS